MTTKKIFAAILAGTALAVLPAVLPAPHHGVMPVPIRSPFAASTAFAARGGGHIGGGHISLPKASAPKTSAPKPAAGMKSNEHRSVSGNGNGSYQPSKSARDYGSTAPNAQKGQTAAATRSTGGGFLGRAGTLLGGMLLGGLLANMLGFGAGFGALVNILLIFFVGLLIFAFVIRFVGRRSTSSGSQTRRNSNQSWQSTGQTWQNNGQSWKNNGQTGQTYGQRPLEMRGQTQQGNHPSAQTRHAGQGTYGVNGADARTIAESYRRRV